MKPSILRRVFLMISIVLITSFSIATIIGRQYLESYFINTKISELKPQMQAIAADIGEKGYSSIPLFEQGFILKAYDLRSEEMEVFPNRPDSVSEPEDVNPPLNKDPLILEEDIRNTIHPFMSRVLTGSEIAEIIKSEVFRDSQIILAYPIKRDGSLIGSLFLLKSVKEYTSARDGFYATFILTAALVLAFTLFVIYRVLRPIIKPLQVMTASSNAMAKGNFKVRVPANGYGELGDLAQSFNTLAANLEVNQKAAMTLEQLRRDYVANVSHELRTPIAAIRAMSETLCDDMLQEEEQKQKYYHSILYESIRLHRLINDMLELSRLQSGSAAIEKTLTPVGPILERIETRFCILAEDLDIHFIIAERARQMPSFWGHADRVEQILVILLDNAFKFTEAEGSVTLDASCSEGVITVTVSDTGKGIEGNDIPFVFERFYQSDKSHSSTGTGLGLSLAREIITKMDETIGVECVDGGGSRFYFTLHLPEESLSP